MANKHIPKSVEELKSCIETQLERMQSLSLEENRVQLENDLHQEICDENTKNLELQKAALQQIASNIYERRDNFCKSIYETITEIQQNTSSTTSTFDADKTNTKRAIEEEFEKVDLQIAQLRRLNTLVNMEMIVIKADLERVKNDQKRVYSCHRSDQEKIKEHISELQSEVQQLHIDVTSCGESKRQNVEDILTIAPVPKRQYISDSVPPNSPNFSDDEDGPEKNAHHHVVYDFSRCFDATYNKPKIEFKFAVESGDALLKD